MKRLFFAMPSGRFSRIFPEYVVNRLRSNFDILNTPLPEKIDERFIIENQKDAAIIVTSWGTPALSEAVIAANDAIEFVAHAAGSVRPIVSDALWERKIAVTSGAKAIADGVAEFSLGLTLTCSKRAFWYARRIREGYWPRGEEVFGPPFEIFRQNVGVIGAGYVGRKFIELLKPFSCNVLLFDPYVASEEAERLGVELVDTLDELFSRSRVVSVHAPTTEETKGMIRGSHFAQLQPGSLFINTARGAIVREGEMIEELSKGRFVACLDVTDPEPPALDSPLRRLPNVLLTPHEAGSIAENLARIGEFILSEIEAYESGAPLRGEVTKERLVYMA